MENRPHTITGVVSSKVIIIQVLNKLPTDQRHIRVPQDRLLCRTHVDNKTKQVFDFFLFLVCYTTRPQWSPFKTVTLP